MFIRREGKSMVTRYGWLVIGLVSTVLFLGACAPTPKPTATPTPTPTPIPSVVTKAASELVLELEDLPPMWKVDKEGIEDGYYSRYFRLSHEFIWDFLTVRVKVFPTIEEARNEYEAKLAAVQPRFSTSSPRVGEEAFAYAGEAKYTCLFRKSNVIGIAELSFVISGGSPPSLQEALDRVIGYAQELERKIS